MERSQPRDLPRALPVRLAMVWTLLFTVACHQKYPAKDDSGDLETGVHDTSDDTGEEDPWPEEDFGWSLLAKGQANLLLTYDVALDPLRRRGFAIGLETDTIAAFDLDSGEILRWYDLGERRLGLPMLSVDGLGVLWIVGNTARPLVRLDPETGELDFLDAEGRILNGVEGLPEGGVFVTGREAESFVMTRWEADGTPGPVVEIPGNATSTHRYEGGTRVALSVFVDERDQRLLEVDPSSLEILRECPAPLAGDALVRLAEGRYVLSQPSGLAAVSCDGSADLNLTTGLNNKDLFAVGDEVIVLDRLGEAGTESELWSVARRFSAELVQRGDPFVTGKYSGYGEQDSSTGTLWLASEGTTEVRAYDLERGDLEQRLRLGTHIEALAHDPDHVGRIYFAGRLTGSVGWLDLASGEHQESAETLGWPRSPVIVGKDLWVVDHLSSDLHILDPETLALRETLDLDLPANATLFFDTLAYHAERGTWFLAQGDTRTVVEIDPEDGALLGRWELEGEEPSTPFDTAVFDLAITEDAVFAYHSWDGTLARLDLEAPGSLEETQLVEDVRDELGYSAAPLLLYASRDSTLLYVGGLAFDAASLEPEPTLDRAVDRMLAQTEGGDWIGWQDSPPRVLRLDSEGRSMGSADMVGYFCGDPAPILVSELGERLVYIRLDQGEVRAMKLP